jgi:hypothetical protein
LEYFVYKDIPVLHPMLRELVNMPHTEEVFSVLDTNKFRDHLRISQNLTQEQWDKLWVKNLPQRLAESMAANVLTDDQLARLLKDEKRGSVLVQQFYHGSLDSATQLQILTSAKGSQYVYQALGSGHFFPENLEAASRHFRGIERLEWFAIEPISPVSNQEVIKAFAELETYEGMRHIRNVTAFAAVVCRLIHFRPGLIDDIFAMSPVPGSLVLSLASSRLISKPSHQEVICEMILDRGSYEYESIAFVANPVVSIDLVKKFSDSKSERVQASIKRRLERFNGDSLPSRYEDIEDMNHIEWVLRRSMPTTNRPDGKSHDLVALAMNKNLQRSQAIRIQAALKKASTMWTPAKELNKALDSLESRFSLKPVPRFAEKGFWDQMMSDKHSPWFRGYSFSEKNWRLDKNTRPWSREEVETAYAALSKESLAAIESGTMNPWDLEISAVHVYLYYHLADNLPAWGMLASLMPKHLGSLKQLVSASKRLAR